MRGERYGVDGVAGVVGVFGRSSRGSWMKVGGIVQFNLQGFLQRVVDRCVFVTEVPLVYRVERFAREYCGWKEVKLSALVFASLRVWFAIPLNLE